MNPDPSTGDSKNPLPYNKLIITGAILSLMSLLVFLFYLGLDIFGGGGNPYTGIFTYFVIPIFLFTGLIMIVFGFIKRRKRIHLEFPDSAALFPTIDLNSPVVRRRVLWTVLLLIGLVLLSAVAGYRAYHFSDSVAFCGLACHQVMEPEYTAYLNSPHARVKCVQCHIGPGASWFVRSKITGAYQIYATAFNKYPRPIPVPIKNLRPAQDTCEQCHWPRHFFGAVQKENHHYLSDEENTHWVSKLLIKVGGGDLTIAPAGGIHWFMSIDNRIEYVATDPQRQNIAWIRRTDSEGNVTIYESEEEPLGRVPNPDEIRVLDCIDCHGRPSHIYRSPMKAINLAIRTGRLDPGLPYIKAKSMELLSAKYETRDDALLEISEGLTSFYKEDYPNLYASERTTIEASVRELSTIYLNNFFPEMAVRWDVYPNNTGHLIWKGCYRCHDNMHSSEEGDVIDTNCNDCHIFISHGSGEDTAVSLEGLEFKHPVDIDRAWMEMPCYECHTGAGL